MLKQKLIRTLGGATFLGALAAFGPMVVADTVVTTTSTGTISEFSPETMVIRTETAPAPIHYTIGKEVTYVDDTGAPVAVDVVKSGLPVSVDYVKDGDRMIVRKVIVHRRAAVVPAAPAAPVVEEHKSTTTTTTTREK
jgi:hypothetical protein